MTAELPRLSLALLLALALPTAVRAQDPALAGSWQLDLEASDERRNGPPLVATVVDVELHGDDVEITRTFFAQGAERTHQATYVTDGKPHEVPGGRGDTQTVRAKWRKDKLQVSYAVSRGPMALDVTEVWAVNKDGDLQVTYSTRVQDRNVTRKEIYRKP